MTRRERLERKIEKRQDWADGREQKSEQAFDAALKISSGIPIGQPILVGHHSEKRSRRDQDKIHNNMQRGIEHEKMAKQHKRKAAGLRSMLDHSIFSDDPDAIENLQERIERREALQAAMKRINATIRKNSRLEFGDQVSALIDIGVPEGQAKKILMPDFMGRVGFPQYALTNNSASIRRDKQRMEEIAKREQSQLEAEQNGGMTVKVIGEYVRVTFAEKPEREILNALREAGFRWSGGNWTGRISDLNLSAVLSASILLEGL